MRNRVCVLTPSGRGAVAVVSIEGPSAVSTVDGFFRAVNKRSLPEQSLGRIVYGNWGGTDGEDLILCRRNQDSLEIHCHGGRQSSAQIVADLTAAGCENITAKDWVIEHHKCPLSAAACQALTQATTFRAAAILWDQYQGALRRDIEEILTNFGVEESQQAIVRLERLLQYAELGCHLTKPWRVVIAGRPNVGKSSLINALVGYERAIVFDQPGTTRDVVSSATAIEGWPVELSDTAGLHESTDAIETAGIALARQRLIDADLIVWVLDARDVSQHADDVWQVAEKQAEAVGEQLHQKQSIVVINKIDLVDRVDAGHHCMGTSAVTGEGIEQLLNAMATCLVPSEPPPGAAMPFTPAQVETLRGAHHALSEHSSATMPDGLRELLDIGRQQ